MIDWWCYNSVTPPHRVIQSHPQPIIHSPHNTVMTTDCTLSLLSLSGLENILSGTETGLWGQFDWRDLLGLDRAYFTVESHLESGLLELVN